MKDPSAARARGNLAEFGHLGPTAPGEAGERGVYVHIPFCIVRCPYCDFNAYAGMDDLAPAYVQAMLREIERAADGDRVTTIFFGGGTPTQLPALELARILQSIRDSFDVDPEAEITVEANPESVDERVFESLLEAGFNRVSIGVQSLASHVLARLGRVHSAERGRAALVAAQSAGFQRVNADLIFGTPGESLDDWRLSLDGVLECDIDHLSAYALTIEEGTPLAAWVSHGDFPAPDEDDQAAKYETAHGILIDRGFVRYEISNWARPGEWSRHNVNYWQGGDYLGFGAGAHTHRSGRRSWNVNSPRTYIEMSPTVEGGFERLGHDQRVQEAAVLGTRLAGGIDLTFFEERLGVDPVDRWRDEIVELRALRLIEIDRGFLRATERGFLFAGHIARSFMA